MPDTDETPVVPQCEARYCVLNHDHEGEPELCRDEPTEGELAEYYHVV